MRKKIAVVSIASMVLMSVCTAKAQTVEELKAQVNTIKRSSEYIFGQAAGEDEKVCYEMAHENFMRKFKEYIQKDSTLKGAEAVILPTINKKVKTITFERNINSKVVCLYVNKKDIVPVYERNIVSLKETKSDEPAKSEEKSEPISQPARPENEKGVVSQPAKTENVPMANTGANERSVNMSAATTTTKTADAASSKLKEIQTGNEKSSYLLSVIATAGDFDKVRKVLEQRINSEHDIMFKATMTYSAENAYWAVFDKKKNLIALLDKDKRIDMLTNQQIDSASYSDKPKIWIQIY